MATVVKIDSRISVCVADWQGCFEGKNKEPWHTDAHVRGIF